jgi:hypothetical protein
MKDVSIQDCLQTGTVTLERVNYFNRQLLTAEDMITERDYFLQKLRRHNRYLHGWGVVCGLQVAPSPTTAAPWRVQIGSGYALGPYGDEIYVPQPVFLDLAKCGPNAATDPCEPGVLRPGTGGIGGKVYVVIKYAECLSRPVRAMPPGCGCDDEPCEYSRIRDSFQVSCLTNPAKVPQPPPTLCELWRGGITPPCPPCPTDPWVVLALATLPPSPSSQIATGNLDNAVRRIVASTALLQEQIIRCCCGPAPSSSSSSSSSSPARAVADLSITQDITLSKKAAGEVNTFLIRVTNLGPFPAENVLVLVTTDLKIVNTPIFGFPWTIGPGGNGLQANLGTIPPGASNTQQFEIFAEIGKLPFEVVFVSTASVSSTTTDPNLTNNSVKTKGHF